ncbi:hypothetical protein [Streptomyces sp. NBC_00057]|uniref:hypothetical protein n=1 Tax=Streptomyces sp. NBC_00057 TaxID=2975634 RepID=UPI003245435B
MDPVVLAAGTALVSAMTTDAWQQARTAAIAWWRQARPDRAGQVENDLDGARIQLLAARDTGDEDTEQAMIGAWQLRLHQLLAEDPALAEGLRRLLESHLQPALPTSEQNQIGSIVQRAEARDNARVYMAGRDQHITDR